MNVNSANPWELLFPPDDNPSRSAKLHLRLMRKRGEPLLLLPARNPAAATSLALYPAQSFKARLARTALGTFQNFGIQPGTTPVELRLNPDSPFVKFLCPAGSRLEDLNLAILFGNPHTTGRRFVLLVFDRDNRPVRVIKAGVGSERALELLRNEIQFLKKVPSAVLQSPATQNTCDTPDLVALAQEYIPGPTPKANDASAIPEILESWLSREAPMHFGDLPAARRLTDSARTDNATRRILEKLNKVRLRPAIHHGDFAPWNIRINPSTRRWVVLDWERGESAGPPAWDWFHFILQPEILVRRASPEAVFSRAEKLLHDTTFLRYATNAGIETNLSILLLGYVIHCRDITRQTEGMPTIEALAELLQAQTLEL